MVFNSASFLLFFSAFFIIYWFVNNKGSKHYRNLLIIIASYIFYGWWDWRFLSLIVISSVVDFSVGLLISNAKRPTRRKMLLWGSILVNLGILGFFKYYNFFIDSLEDLLSLFSLNPNSYSINIILPVGISFYTFQTLSYTIDVYRNKLKPTKDILAFFAFVSFFPQLVAGPIERASHLLPQFNSRKIFAFEKMIPGLRLILWGFFKKVVIADNAGIIADLIFDPTNSYNGLAYLVGALFFGFQIYADFSGYSDMAIGLAAMLGFHLKKNFASPYFAKTITEFWHRWHISLSTWFRDYVYIPLGGNRGTQFQIYRNIFISFLLSGLWHGANWNFLIWGSAHGLLLIFEKQFSSLTKLKLHRFSMLLIVFVLWIPFRAENPDQLMQILSSIVDFTNYDFSIISDLLSVFTSSKWFIYSALLFCFVLVERSANWLDFNEWIRTKKTTIRFAFYYLIVLSILFMGNFSVKPNFIYFQF
jgi:D-alanyl-lipoteichoic acid acyltransferase DltB (MBOAT superfamily)